LVTYLPAAVALTVEALPLRMEDDADQQMTDGDRLC